MPGEGFVIRHRLPGRLRLYLPGLKKGLLLPGNLVDETRGIPGVQGVRASSLTGSLLLFYRPREIEEVELLHRVGELIARQDRTLPVPGKLPPLVPDFLRLAAGGGILAALVLKRLIAGEPPLARSPRVVNSAALVTAITGYPLLHRGLTCLSRGRGVNADLLLAGAAISLLLLRESLPGLLILVLAEGLRLTERLVSRRARATLACLAEGREYTLKPASLPPAEAGRVNDYVERASKLALGLTGVTYLWWRDARQALAMLVAGAPVATSLGETAIATAGMRRASENGVLVYDGRHFLALPALDTLVWCQGRLLSSGRPVLQEVYSLDPAYNRATLLKMAAAALGEVPHPMATVLWRRLQEKRLTPPRAREARLLPGGAVEATVEGHRLLVGTASALRWQKIAGHRGRTREQRYLQLGLLPLYIVIDGRPTGLLAFEEQLKEEALAVIDGLRALGLRQQILLSDAGPEATGLLARQLGLENYRAGVTPEEKVAVIRGLQDQGHLVAAVGSGEDDELALAAADFSLALGRPLATADMLSLGPDPARVVDIFRLARRADMLYRQEFLFVRAANILGMGMACLKLLSPATAMVWQNFLSLILLINAGRLRWPGEPGRLQWL
ncbi:Potassium-transporting ATPase ATP-binding subunit [Moorella thermoacetica]|uniref:Copper-exporting P-type ATPase A n=1 Tax=Neomoorella thermoacetica TaxID=1525 RepID=A0AAC9HF82_NEOTH|nr:HAD family hydrolase [Moorella thermoacetica]AOQ22887.1 Copper-exporting P-type ATPase A [Moorella thermoacetica]TYL09973.1 Potassium-transporting ATPase ATP-binding subunit [Moorella thermoacetica]